MTEISEPVIAGRRPHSEVAAILVLRAFNAEREPGEWDLTAGQVAHRAGLPARVVCRALQRMDESGEVEQTAPQGWETWNVVNGIELARADRRYRLT